jgi:hypothetical protein
MKLSSMAVFPIIAAVYVAATAVVEAYITSGGLDK